jgi:hypothetical protein
MGQNVHFLPISRAQETFVLGPWCMSLSFAPSPYTFPPYFKIENNPDDATSIFILMKTCPKPPPKTNHLHKSSPPSPKVSSMQPLTTSQKSMCYLHLTTFPPQQQDQAKMSEAPAQLKPTEAPRTNRLREHLRLIQGNA